MGGPATLADIEPFLVNLLSDVLPAPRLIRSLLARLIARKRAPRVAPLYQKIGGGSPLLRNTAAQAEALESELNARGYDAKVLVCMRYTAPRVGQALALARRDWSDATWIALPLYPQYSLSTSKTSLDDLCAGMSTPEMTRLVSVPAYPTDDGYLAALVECVREGLMRFSAEERARMHLVFSAHSLPLSYVKQGDPYPTHVQQTVAGVTARLGAPPPHHLAYQSKLGPVKWLTPSTVSMVQELAAKGVKEILVVPVSFVSDHIETLSELDLELKELAHKAGITHFERAPVPAARATFIQGLAGIVEHALPTDN